MNAREKRQPHTMEDARAAPKRNNLRQLGEAVNLNSLHGKITNEQQPLPATKFQLKRTKTVLIVIAPADENGVTRHRTGDK